MRLRLLVLIAAVVAGAATIVGGSPAEAYCGYNPCQGRAQYGYGYNYNYGYQYAQPYYQQQYYAQPYYQQQYYQQPAYYQPQPYYPQPAYAQPCCEPNWWDKMWGAKSCCQQGYAQTGYAVEASASWNSNASWDSSWNSSSLWPSSNNSVQINNNGNVYVTRDGVSVSNGFGPDYAYGEPAAPGAETYVQPAPRYYRKRYRASRHGPRVVVRTVYRTRVVYARPRRPHVLVPGNPSSSAGTYEVGPKKVLRP